MLDYTELLEIEEEVKMHMDEHLCEVLVNLNRTDRLGEFLSLIGMQELLGMEKESNIAEDGKIIVIGQSDVPKEKLVAVAKQYGIEKNRLEFFLDYNNAKTFDFRKTQWSTKYSYILVGPMPHSGMAKEEYGSVISALEKQDGYPPVIRMGTEKLKITKSSFRKTLEYIKELEKVA